MSYLYDSLRDALGGKTFKSGTVIKNWSPNEVRAIIIMRNFILIADYLKQPKVIPLNENEVGLDLLNAGRRGNLNNLLENRQLSCLEEIYVDSCFMQHMGVLNLQDYVNKMYNTSSRLRYYGYVRGFDSNMISQAYSQALINGVMDFTIAKNIGGFDYNSTKNDKWYEKYNLRPQYYAIDSERGKLHTYFSKCEKVVGANLSGKEEQIKELTIAKTVIDAFNVDTSMALRVKYLLDYVTFCRGCDNFASNLASHLQNNLMYKSKINGLTKEKLNKYLSLAEISKVPVTNEAKFMIKLYQKIGLFDENDCEIDLREIKASQGLYQLGNRLNYGLGEFIDSISKKEYLMHIMISTHGLEGLPEGPVITALDKKNILHCNVLDVGDVDNLIKLAYFIGGFTEKDFELYCLRKRGA